ncbi:30S ribosomal protein S13 [archaeon]|nr:30S ribosomal protein S13 [archaeon]|tara:strand:- start:294 stop:758 length:465 start_codon:yes stop_codon:yes gene_type:complete
MAEQNPNFKHIVRIANIDVPGGKAIRIALTKIKGVGVNLADVVCHLAGVDKQQKAGNLDQASVDKLTDVLKNPLEKGIPIWMTNRRRDYESGEDKHLLTGTLDFAKDNDLKRLQKIKSLRGMRHGKRLPVRGQRTRSNFRRSKGKVVGVKKKGK